MPKQTQNEAVAAVLATYPEGIRNKLLELRQLIFETAAQTPGVGPIEETLKWGEPSYLTPSTNSGTTIRLAWSPKRPELFALHVHCQTNLIDQFRDIAGDQLTFEGNRSVVFARDASLPVRLLRPCIAAALTYHQRG